MRIVSGRDSKGRVARSGIARGGLAALSFLVPLLVHLPVWQAAPARAGDSGPGPTGVEAPVSPTSTTLAAIEACVSANLPEAAGVIGFSVEAIDRSGETTLSRAEVRWRKDEAALASLLLRVSEPARTAGTALLILDRESDQPEFYLSLPKLKRVKRVRSKRLRGPVLGTDFSFEDLKRLRDPLDRANLTLLGETGLDGHATWLLEAIPGEEEGSEYARVLTWVDQAHCVPIRVDLFEEGDRLRKRLLAPLEEIRTVGSAHLPHVFVMEDLRRETRTIVRIEHFESSPDLPAEQFTKNALEAPASAAVLR